MFELIFPMLVSLISFALLITVFLLIIRGNLLAQVRMFAWQSLLLSLLGAAVAAYTGSLELLGVALVFVAVKAIAIPRILKRAIVRIGLHRETVPYLGTPASLAVSGFLVVVAFTVMAPLADSSALPTAGGVPLAFSGTLIAFFVTVIRRRALTQILGFLMLENCIFMLALLATYGVPFIVEMGVFLDVLVAVLILEVFVYRIKENFDSVQVDQLGRLKG